MANIAISWFYLMLTAVLQHGATAVTLIFLANKTNPEVYGKFSSIWAVINIGAMLALIGMNRIVTREIAAKPDNHRPIMKVYPLILTATSFISVIGIVWYLYRVESIVESQLLSFIVFYFILFIGISFFESIFYGHSKFILFGVIGSIGSVVLVLLTVFFLSAQNPLELIFIFLTASTLLKLIILTVFYFRLNRVKPNNEKYEVKRLLEMSLPFYGTVLLGIPFLQLPVLLVSQLSGPTEAGYYGIIIKFTAPLLILTQNLNTILFSKFSRDYALRKIDFAASVGLIFNFLLAFSGISILVISVFSREIIEIFVGVNYLPAVDSLVLNWWVTLMAVIHNFIGTVMLAVGKEKLLMRLSIINSAVMTVTIYISAHFGAFGMLIGIWLGYFLFLGYLLYISGIKTIQFVSINRIVIILGFILIFTAATFQLSLLDGKLKILLAAVFILVLGIVVRSPRVHSVFHIQRIIGLFKENRGEGIQ